MVEPRPNSPSLHTTVELLELARRGQESAWNELFRRYKPLLLRWAHRRLPLNARERFDTDDLVQTSLIRAHQHLAAFEPRRDGSFLAFIRKIITNQIRDEIRRRDRRPERVPLQDEIADGARDPLAVVLEKEGHAHYVAALDEMPAHYRGAVVLRFEFLCTYADIAAELDLPSGEAARLVTRRAVAQLVRRMRDREAR